MCVDMEVNMARQWSEGHSTPVLCVGVSASSVGLLASGSEEGGVSVWSQEGTILGRLQLPGEEDVTNVVFSPIAQELLYVSHGENISAIDPRNLKGVVEQYCGIGEEEINGLAVNETGSALALADDAGAVRVLDLPDGKVSRTLRKHTNICSSVTFRPHRPNNLVSAGLDMQVMLWGLQKTRPLWTLNLQEVVEKEGQLKAGQLFNPPLAHCVSVATCGNILACAAEDGNVHLLRIGNGSQLEQQGALKAHSQGVSQAHFLSFLSHPYWLASGGNDGLVALWDLSQHPVVAPEGMAKIGAPAAHHRRPRGRKKKKNYSLKNSKTHPEKEGAKGKGDHEEKEEGRGDEESVEGECSTLNPSAGAKGFNTGPSLSFSHGDKVNWVCPALLKGEPSLVVADQSSNLTVYSLAGL